MLLVERGVLFGGTRQNYKHEKVWADLRAVIVEFIGSIIGGKFLWAAQSLLLKFCMKRDNWLAFPLQF